MSSVSPGQVLLAGIESDRLSSVEKRVIEEVRPAGVTLFKRNVPPNLAALSKLTTELQRFSGDAHRPMIIAIDQEGGRVSRLPPPFPNLGPAEKLFDGKTNRASLEGLYRYGEDVGNELIKLGINVDFAPVVDVLTDPTNVAIGDRVFGFDPESVVKRAGAFLNGLQKTGVWGSLKHFPGQGAAPADTHKASAVIDADLETLVMRDIAPFKNLLPEAAMVMISHCIYPALDDLPASLSSKIMKGLLRDELGFKGVIVSDDMNMEAINQSEDVWLDSMVECLMAGADLLLVCRHIEKTMKVWERFRIEAARSPAFSARLIEASEKVSKLRLTLPKL